MIGWLRGTLLEKRPGAALVNVNGIGYEVEIPYTTYYQLPDIGRETTLYTHFAVREDAHALYGFSQKRDRELFRQLIKVSGVGPKLALAILSGLDVEHFVRCIELDDVNALVKLPGVGKKTAERLIIEMRDRIRQLETPVLTSLSSEALPLMKAVAEDVRGEAESALIALGYKPAEVTRMISKVFSDGMTSEQIIRQALRGTVRDGA